MFKVEMKMQIVIDGETLQEILNFKDSQLKQKENELKYRKDKHVGLI